MSKHYVLIRQTVTKTEFRRIYLEIEPDSDPDAAVEAWLDAQVAGRRRNVAAAREDLRATIENVRVIRPSSWWQAHSELSPTNRTRRKH